MAETKLKILTSQEEEITSARSAYFVIVVSADDNQTGMYIHLSWFLFQLHFYHRMKFVNKLIAFDSNEGHHQSDNTPYTFDIMYPWAPNDI